MTRAIWTTPCSTMSKSIAPYREIDDKSGVAGGWGNLANVLDTMGNLPEALKMQQAGLATFREVGDQRGTASTLSNLGNLLVENGEPPGCAGEICRSAAIEQSNRL